MRFFLAHIICMPLPTSKHIKNVAILRNNISIGGSNYSSKAVQLNAELIKRYNRGQY